MKNDTIEKVRQDFNARLDALAAKEAAKSATGIRMVATGMECRVKFEDDGGFYAFTWIDQVQPWPGREKAKEEVDTFIGSKAVHNLSDEEIACLLLAKRMNEQLPEHGFKPEDYKVIRVTGVDLVREEAK